ncbi:UDP-N-acetylmuramate dehydrogenase, partial [bacterium]|nr:UDP-N-acetylmuramate dehydrogenase [bacterium]
SISISGSAELRIRPNVELSRHCRFGVGGPADWFVEVRSAEDIREAYRFARERGLPCFTYSGGSNLFFDSSGFRGLVVRLIGGGWTLDPETHVVDVTSGTDLPLLIRNLARLGVGGADFLGNIPGAVGGAVVGNAGCYGRSIEGMLLSAEIYDIETDSMSTALPEYFEFSYRHSRLKHDPLRMVVSARLQFAPADPLATLEAVESELSHRLSKHPHDSRCAGSFFKNISREQSAWKLITEAGLAESRVGGAMLSPMHANFLVNDDAATSADILALCRLVQRGVRDRLGLVLETEVRYVGPAGIEEIRTED